LWVGFEGDEAVGKGAFDRVEVGEDVVGKAVLPQRLPKVFGRVQLGAVRRQEDHAHVRRHGKITGNVPACLSHDHHDELVAVALRHLAERV
jgi:hypothetical protein